MLGIAIHDGLARLGAAKRSSRIVSALTIANDLLQMLAMPHVAPANDAVFEQKN